MNGFSFLEQSPEQSAAFVVIAEYKINNHQKKQQPDTVVVIIAARITRFARVTRLAARFAGSAWVAAMIIISHKKNLHSIFYIL
jgi:hypothetical protein